MDRTEGLGTGKIRGTQALYWVRAEGVDAHDGKNAPGASRRRSGTPDQAPSPVRRGRCGASIALKQALRRSSIDPGKDRDWWGRIRAVGPADGSGRGRGDRRDGRAHTGRDRTSLGRKRIG